MEIFKAPFGKVRFRDFFFADVITSMGVPLKDLGTIVLLDASLENHEENKVSEGIKTILPYYVILVGFLPSWWRFCQCLNKYYNHNAVTQLYNAGKYFSKMIPHAIVLFYSKCNKIDGEGFILFLLSMLFATFYSLVWDYYMDWGLFRSKEKGKYMLREVIQYPANFYYFAMVINFLLRFFWVFSIFYLFQDDFSQEYQILAFLNMMSEAIRRTIWALIRIENEFHNNLENYRSVLKIPGLMDDVK